MPLHPNQLVDRGDGTVEDGATQLVWQAIAAPGDFAWEEAVAHCDALGVAGHADWRLPTFSELQTIVDFEASLPAIAPPLEATPTDVFWSATTSPFFVPASVGGAAWPISFDNGLTQPEPRTNRHRARCVRGGIAPFAPPNPRFVVETAGTTLDRLTQLEWGRGIAVNEYTPFKAFGYCQHLDSGHWHLPTVPELSTLIDRTRSYGAVDPTAELETHAPVQAGHYPVDPVYAHWYVDFGTGAIGMTDNDTGHHIRCARPACGNTICGMDETPASCPMDCALPVEISPVTTWLGCDAAGVDGGGPTCPINASPQKQATVARFRIQQTELTVQAWIECALAGVCVYYPPDLPFGHTWPVLATRPINYVSWSEARTYCQKWLGEGWDLPTEEQWELAARGPCAGTAAECAKMQRPYPWGQAPPDCDHARFTPTGDVAAAMGQCTELVGCGCGTQMPGNTAEFSAGDTPTGIHDLAGNVAEWVRAGDGSQDGAVFVTRGGGFNDGPGWLHATARRVWPTGDGQAGIGFRCVKGE